MRLLEVPLRGLGRLATALGRRRRQPAAGREAPAEGPAAGWPNGHTRIVVCHLTRMQPGYICVAGVDIDTAEGRHIRPVLPHGRLEASLLQCSGGPFGIASVVDLGLSRSVGQAPDVEDHVFDPARAIRLGAGGPESFWTVLTKCSRARLTDIFGGALQPRGRGCAVDLGQGQASLGCLRPRGAPDLYVDRFGRARLRLEDGVFTADLPVTDIRLYEPDQVTVRRQAIDYLTHEIGRGAAVLLCVGLTRPWQKPDDTVERHWLQVNNIHLADNPTWDGELP